MARDLPAAQEFYRAVLGWSFRSTSLGDEFSVGLVDGEAVAGIGALASTLRTAVAWTPYFVVDDVNAATSRVRERSATVAVGPLAMKTGRGALAADPDGAVFGLWEGRIIPGWSIGKGQGPARLELRTRDAFAAAIFYGQVLQWAAEGAPGGTPGLDVHYEEDRVNVRDDGRTVCSLRGGAVGSAPDPRIRPRWQVSFRVPDVDAAEAAAVAAGGEVVAPASSPPTGREATLRDPDGGMFTVVSGH
ncbi:VOC family protein [Streptomyces liangshanensis]|uniref:VOC family protein n=1 Tax=Streptomyces liangshanensis TaxID=2717324 RepID=A0A6G9H856_9ACTN|nr:VOC family protein [Streptomyces liangshanensis]QIQ06486.1 VOC family protein [Streptomyces liangshanensis]